jgi:hypothetical protein
MKMASIDDQHDARLADRKPSTFTVEVLDHSRGADVELADCLFGVGNVDRCL